MKINVAIDGPSGVGKSSLAKAISDYFDLTFINTGLMYRAITYFFNQKNKINDLDYIKESLPKIEIELLQNEEIIVNGNHYKNELWNDEISILTSEIISKIDFVRDFCVSYQQKIINSGKGFVMEGRDIGTVVMPDADIKFFLMASAEERAKRRVKQLKEKLHTFNEDEILENIIKRDKNDENRKINPLKKAEDAILIDTTKISFDQVKELLIKKIKELK